MHEATRTTRVTRAGSSVEPTSALCCCARQTGRATQLPAQLLLMSFIFSACDSPPEKKPPTPGVPFLIEPPSAPFGPMTISLFQPDTSSATSGMLEPGAPFAFCGTATRETPIAEASAFRIGGFSAMAAKGMAAKLTPATRASRRPIDGDEKARATDTRLAIIASERDGADEATGGR